MTKFQEELIAAVSDAIEQNYYFMTAQGREAVSSGRLKSQEASHKLESLINRAVDRTEDLCGVCQYNLDNHPPGPGEPNIFTYKKALELACYYNQSHLNQDYILDDELTEEEENIINPEYWIKQAEAQKDND